MKSIAGTLTQVDQEPDDFQALIFNQINVGLGATVTSNTFSPLGVDSFAQSTITVDIGTYSIDGAPHTSVPGIWMLGQTIELEHTASGSNSTPTPQTVTIGGVQGTFISTTQASGGVTVGNLFNAHWDTQPLTDGSGNPTLGGVMSYSDPALVGSAEDAFPKVQNRAVWPWPSGSQYQRTIHDDEHAQTGTQSCKLTYYTGDNEGTVAGGNVYTFGNVAYGSEFWARIYMYHPSSWNFDNNNKIFRVNVFPGNIGYHDIYWDNSGVKMQSEILNWASATTSAIAVPTDWYDRWVAFEQYIKLGVASDPWEWRMYIDGVKVFDARTSDLLDGNNLTYLQTTAASGWATARTTSDYIAGVYIHSQINSPGWLLPNQSKWVDNFVITSQTPNQTDADGDPFIGVTPGGF